MRFFCLFRAFQPRLAKFHRNLMQIRAKFYASPSWSSAAEFYSATP
ncbi:hypothetical protein CAMGR0001_2854 [Campylobacter gracilis RM3268]|uniref:Uncharacterized protein n=1 Tax=Campylobacter gracilis RM3268 TaxID=553220 RepID=C8PL63_9BACT|nr:hypothetical protein CAMGR0001_2854 [Campylobacter gracilis RM3268]